eukprot:6471205-Amphidinium_carterae.1
MSLGSTHRELGRRLNPRRLLLPAFAVLSLVLALWSHRRSTGDSVLDFVAPDWENISAEIAISPPGSIASEITGWNNGYAKSL